MAGAVSDKYVERTRASETALDTHTAMLQGWPLLLLVFVGGTSVMAVEMAASRLLAPYFGTSQFIWANLIGLIMIYLSLGAWLGGKLADRYPNPQMLSQVLAIAGAFVAIVPILAPPILSWSQEGFSQISVGIFYGSLIGVILLFLIPVTLLGTITPFAIRLRVSSVVGAGRTAGSLGAISSVGSILGTFGATFLLIPQIGTAHTLYSAAVALLAVAALGLYMSGAPKRAAVVGVGLLVVLAMAFLLPSSLIRPPPYGTLLTEVESSYNYIQVVETDSKEVHLVLNEGHAIHSLYKPGDQPLTGGPWDYWLVAPYFNTNFRPADVKNMLMLGSAAGTASKLATMAYGAIPIDNIEIDPEIIKLGREYFHLNEPNINNIEQDARYYLATTDKKYSIVGIDAYHQPYIPFHLTTVEFFQEVRDHLLPNGVVMINAGRTGNDYRLVDAISSTMRQVYPHVYVIDVATMGNSMIVGTNDTTSIANFSANAKEITQPLLTQVLQASIEKGNIREVRPASETGNLVFTDDKAPVEEVINQLIFGYIEAH